MNQDRLNFIKGELFNHQQETADIAEQAVFSAEQAVERKKWLLQQSGVTTLFEEIIADGAIRLSDEPIVEDVYTENKYANPGNGPQSRITETNIISAYSPAEIAVTDTTISLQYNHHSRFNNSDRPGVEHYHDEVRFVIVDDLVMLANENVPLTGQNLDELVVMGLKNPIEVRRHYGILRRSRLIKRQGDGKRKWWM